MQTPWKLFKIDCVNEVEFNQSLSSYRKRRQKQLLLWEENNITSTFNNKMPGKIKNEAIVSNKEKLNKESYKEDSEEDEFRRPKPKESSSEKRKTEKSLKEKYAEKTQKLHRTKISPESSRVQKAKERIARERKEYLEKAIKQYNEKEKDVDPDIPNLTSAIKMSIDSLTFPTDLLKQLRDQNGSGRNGKLCNLEAGWLPKPQSTHIPDYYEHHILPRHIKQPKTIDQRQEERLRTLRKIAEEKGLDPVTNQPLPYLFV